MFGFVVFKHLVRQYIFFYKPKFVLILQACEYFNYYISILLLRMEYKMNDDVDTYISTRDTIGSVLSCFLNHELSSFSTVTSPYLRIYNMETKVSFIGFKIQNEIAVHTRKIIN